MKKPTEMVTFYPTYGYQKDEQWNIPMRLWVRERSDWWRRKLLDSARGLIKKKVGLEQLNETQMKMFLMRAENFVADNESFEKVEFVFDKDPIDERFVLVDEVGGSRTDFNGLQHGTLKLSLSRAKALLQAQGSKQGWLTIRAVSNNHTGYGAIQLIENQGVSVISDIDDTIKVTDISAGESVVLMNTFFRDFVVAPTMLDMYKAFGDSVAFHYVSGGPWQMYEPLAEFLFDSDKPFPQGSVHMKNVRLNLFESETYKDLWQLISKGSEATISQKVNQMSQLMNHFPDRKFVLIGDSGEHDPEIFNTIKQERSEQVMEIRIRDVVNDHVNNPQRLAGMTVISTEVNS